MTRPKKDRIIQHPPLYVDFKPAGIRRRSLETVLLSIDEYEAIRLTDYQKMEHAQAADEMEISRSTFTRLVEEARAKIAQFLVEGKHLSITGGNIHFRGNVYQCRDCDTNFNTDIENQITKCPVCGSENITDFAGDFGHGDCCRERTGNKENER